MTGKEFSQRPFTFTRGTKVRLTFHHPVNPKTKQEEVCCFYGISPIYGNSPSDPEKFAPVFRAVAKNGKMSNRRPKKAYAFIFSMIDEIDYADTDEKIRVWIENWGKDGIVVCKDCGSTAVQCKSWTDANTLDFSSDNDYDVDDNWCEECEQHIHFCFLSEFEKKMDNWFNNTDFKTKETMFGLRHEDFDEEDGYQTFVDECESRWKHLSYEKKRRLYNENHN